MKRCVYLALFVQASPSSSKPLAALSHYHPGGRGSTGHWDGAKHCWDLPGGDIHPKCANSPCPGQGKSPPHSGALYGIRMLDSCCLHRNFLGKFRGLEKAFPRDKVDPLPGVLLEMGAGCPRAHSPTLQQRFLPGFFPFGEKKYGFFSPIAAQWKQSQCLNRVTK